MTAPLPKLEELFVGVEMRLVKNAVAPPDRPFTVVATSPRSYGVEVPLCDVAYIPHGLAIAALPEIVDALFAARRALEAYQNRDVGRTVPVEHDAACNALIEVFKKAETLGDEKETGK